MPVKVGLRHIEKWNESLEEQVLAYESQPADKGQIVFYGPSYFTRWSMRFGEIPMEECIKGASGKTCVINRGFGSSCSEHQLYYYPRMIRPLAPKVMVYESFANGESFGYTSEELFELAQRVVWYAKTDFPNINIYLCSGHNSKNMTEKRLEETKEYSGWLMELAKNTPNVFYIDVLNHPSMKRKDIYIEDGVHLNSLGYQLYAEVFKEALKDELVKY
ncbi:MAG: hypothetical protein IJC78_06445 [Clostridia bacterium]|nr:hypothetical protein [Clostridia bacterium]